jgi:hypothetical protein
MEIQGVPDGEKRGMLKWTLVLSLQCESLTVHCWGSSYFANTGLSLIRSEKWF